MKTIDHVTLTTISSIQVVVFAHYMLGVTAGLSLCILGLDRFTYFNNFPLEVGVVTFLFPFSLDRVVDSLDL